MKRPLIEQSFPGSALETLRQAGFECTTVSSQPERIRVMKHNCAALLERQTNGQLKLAQAPGYVFRAEIGRLWDAGYQKFWLFGEATDEPWSPDVSGRRPVSSEQLKALHLFSQELRAALGVPSFYNDSIGTTNDVTAYDRVKGRGESGPRAG
ncbi:MAG: hypothetical protein ACRD35_00500 [Candidatus Acidiferrales bacterium]